MKRISAVILAAALLLVILPASGDGAFEGVWISVELYPNAGRAHIDTLILLPGGTAFFAFEDFSAGSSGWRLVTEFTWRLLPGSGVRLEKVGDSSVTRDFVLDDNGLLWPSDFAGDYYRRIDPNWYID